MPPLVEAHTSKLHLHIQGPGGSENAPVCLARSENAHLRSGDGKPDLWWCISRPRQMTERQSETSDRTGSCQRAGWALGGSPKIQRLTGTPSSRHASSPPTAAHGKPGQDLRVKMHI